MNYPDAIQKELAPGIGELHALKLRMNLLETEFRHTRPDESTKWQLLHLELEIVYKAFMACLIRRRQSETTQNNESNL